MDALLRAGDPAAAPVHAVVITEQQLFQRGASVPDAKSVLASWIPPGPTATADYPTVLLRGTWLTQEQVTAASEFSRFLRKPEQLGEFAKLGFRTDGGETPKSDVTDFAPVSAPLSVGDSAMRATLANALTAPAGAAAGNSAVTIMLDQSMNTQEGGKTRLANVARGTGRAGAVDVPDIGGGVVDVRRCRGSIRRHDGPAVGSCRREALLGRTRGDAG